MKKLVPFIAVGALSACGFHLKGTYAHDHLPEQKWYISGGQLQKPLENAIRHASGTPVAQAAAQAEAAVWSADNATAAEQVCATLAEGVPLPLVLLPANAALAERYAERWLASGAQAVVQGR